MKNSNLINNTKKRPKKRLKEIPGTFKSFRPTKDIHTILEGVIQKTKYINEAIFFNSQMINKPEEIMKRLKNMYPDKYKAIGRKRF